MASFKVKANLIQHGETEVESHEDIVIISDHDDIDTFVQMMYGSWYDIVGFTYEDIRVHMSSRYCREIAIKELQR